MRSHEITISAIKQCAEISPLSPHQQPPLHCNIEMLITPTASKCHGTIYGTTSSMSSSPPPFIGQLKSSVADGRGGTWFQPCNQATERQQNPCDGSREHMEF